MDRVLLGDELRKTSHILRRTIGKSAITTDCKIRKFDMDVIMFIQFMDKPVYQKDIEKELELKKTTVSLGLDKMAEQDLIIRKSVKEDGRLKQIVLTKKAIDLCKDLKKSMLKYEILLMNDITAEEKKVMRDCLEKIRNNAVQMVENKK